MDPKWILNDFQKKQRFFKFFEKKEQVFDQITLKII